MGGVSVIKINAITVPEGSGDELARRFAARAGAVDDQDGFEGFELLQPTDGRTTWLVITRWRDEAAFEAWVSSPAFAHGHRGESAGEGEASGGGGHPGGGHPGGGHPGGGHPGGGGEPAPLAMSSELWSYVVAGGSSPGD
jgi:heme-degrading monooxygenase HmoA